MNGDNTILIANFLMLIEDLIIANDSICVRTETSSSIPTKSALWLNQRKKNSDKSTSV